MVGGGGGGGSDRVWVARHEIGEELRVDGGLQLGRVGRVGLRRLVLRKLMLLGGRR